MTKIFTNSKPRKVTYVVHSIFGKILQAQKRVFKLSGTGKGLKNSMFVNRNSTHCEGYFVWKTAEAQIGLVLSERGRWSQF